MIGKMSLIQSISSYYTKSSAFLSQSWRLFIPVAATDDISDKEAKAAVDKSSRRQREESGKKIGRGGGLKKSAGLCREHPPRR